MQNLSTTIQKLVGQSNYGTWSFAMQMYLTDCDLWDCVEVTDSYKLDTEAAKKKDAKARSKICLMCAESVFPLVVNAKTAKETWNALQKAYADGGLLRRLTLLRKLFSFKLENFADVQLYVTEIQSTHQALQSIKAGLDDEFVAVIMLAGLPEAYNPLVMALEHSNMKLTSDTVITALLKEGQRKPVTSTDTNDSAMISKPSGSRNKMVICHFCKKKGHYKWQCKAFKSHKTEGKADGMATVAASRESDHFITLLSSLTNSKNNWVIDSGATSHMTACKNYLNNTRSDSKHITTANNGKIVSKAKGDVLFENHKIKFEEVLHVPELITNLLSVSRICQHNCVVVFDKTCCRIFNNDMSFVGKPLLTAPLRDGLYFVNKDDKALFLTGYPDNQCAFKLWHRRLGHLSESQMKKLKELVIGLTFQETNKEPCVSCCKGKMCVKKFPKRKNKRAKGLLELVHSDLAGPMEVDTWGGNKYCLIFIDDFSRKTFGYMLKSKTEVLAKFKEFKTLVENQTSKKIKCFRSDNGTEYVNRDFQNFLRQHGIRHQTSVAYTPQQNGVAERTIRTITEKARCMLQDSGLNKRFWGEAMTCAIYLKNRSPTMALTNKVPEEVWSGKKVDVSHFKIFGSKAEVLIKSGRKKFDSKSVGLIMVGYSENQKGYRFMNLKDTRRIIVARDAVFNETMVASSSPIKDNSPFKDVLVLDNNVTTTTQSTVVGVPLSAETIEDSIGVDELIHIRSNQSDLNVRSPEPEVLASSSDREVDTTVEELMTSETEDQFHDSIDSINVPLDLDGASSSVERRYPLRNRKTKIDENFVYNFNVTDYADPASVKDAMSRSDKNLWMIAMQDEFNSLIENKTWQLVNRPDKNVVKSKWVFKLKRGADGSVQRYKARLVAKGYSQIYGEDYFETFAPVVKLSSIRLLLGLAAERNLEVHHIDVTTAFLNGDLEEELYMEQPEMFVKRGEEGKVCKLNKSLYGLKQSPRCWNEKIHTYLLEIGLIPSEYDQCVYMTKNTKHFLAIALYVDDFYIFTDIIAKAEELKTKIGKRFKIKDLGEVRDCLGITVTRDRSKGEIYLKQSNYIKRILEKYGMQDCNAVGTPIECNLRLEKGDKQDDRKYQEIIGSLMYLACATRPDISFTVSYLSQFNAYNNSTHFSALKRVLRYLKGTSEYALSYKRTGKPMTAYADADWGSNSDGHSFTGYALFFGGAAVAWQARKQRCVALSTAEAEYIAICEAAKEVISVKGLLAELAGKIDKPIVIYSDSQSANKLVYSPSIGRRSKHINIRYHFVRELANNKEICIEYCDTKAMPADMLTKGLGGVKHMFCVKHIGLSGGVENR